MGKVIGGNLSTFERKVFWNILRSRKEGYKYFKDSPDHQDVAYRDLATYNEHLSAYVKDVA